MKTTGIPEDTQASQPAPSQRICSSCHRPLPLTAFSNNSNGRPESRCKECQRTRQRQRRQAAGNTQQATASKPERVLITDVAERETRLEMIRNAIETVQLSMIRRACKQHENEFYLETGWKIKMLYKEEL